MLTKSLVTAVGITSILGTGAVAQSSPAREIDTQVWAPVSAAVARDDLAALGLLYHSAAVVVTPSGTARIQAKVKQWAEEANAAKKQGIKATVDFRFNRRQDDATSAFETGMFKYTQTDRSGVAKSRYIPMECLLIKENGKWVILMERQLDAGTEAAWNALPR
jgi:ketosteroid isomerase-like protein